MKNLPVILASVIVSLWLSGCATRVRLYPQSHIPPRTVQVSRLWWQQDALSRQVIHHHHLSGLLWDDTDQALIRLATLCAEHQRAEDRLALIDLLTRYGRKLESQNPAKALGLYLLAAEAGLDGLSKQHPPLVTNIWDAQLLSHYNQAVANTINVWQRNPESARAHTEVKIWNRSFTLRPQSMNASIDWTYYDRWLSASDWRQSGLFSEFHTQGLGAKLIALRTNWQSSTLEWHQPDEGIVHPVTACLNFQTTDADSPQSAREVTLEFHDPNRTAEIRLSGTVWPLAADFTTPWAMLLTQARPLAKTRWTGLLHPAESPRAQRLYLMEPYAPDQIPVIMVHGLRSTPLAWQQLTNELLGDPVLRHRYQVWHYLYPTGLPFLTSAANFRTEIDRLRLLVDPEGKDLATRHMIVIGHSMGGLLARTLVTDSGDAIWDSTFALPLEKLDPALSELKELRRMFYFQPKPYIKRAIFIAVPHRGSKRADDLFGRFMAGQVELPEDLHAFVAGLKKAVPGLLKPEAAPLFDHGYPSSIRTLSPKADGLVALAKLPVSPAIPFHSIIGDRGRGDGKKSSDGVVTYASSHLDGAVSEKFVPSRHRTYDNPQAIAEVKRILKLHLTEMESGELTKVKDTPKE